MSHGTCGGCRFKGPGVAHPANAPGLAGGATGYSICLAMPQLGALRVGAGAATVVEGGDFQAHSSAGVADRSGHGASLCVTDDFGCNRWQPMAQAAQA